MQIPQIILILFVLLLLACSSCRNKQSVHSICLQPYQELIELEAVGKQVLVFSNIEEDSLIVYMQETNYFNDKGFLLKSERENLESNSTRIFENTSIASIDDIFTLIYRDDSGQYFELNKYYSNNLIQKESYITNNKIDIETQFEYNASNKLSKKIHHFSDGSIFSINYEYYDDNFLKTITVYKNDKLANIYEFEIKDSVCRIKYFNSEMQQIGKYYVTLDSNNNPTKQTYYHLDAEGLEHLRSQIEIKLF